MEKNKTGDDVHSLGMIPQPVGEGREPAVFVRQFARIQRCA